MLEMEASSGMETIETVGREVASGATPPLLDQMWTWWNSGSCTYKASNMRKQQREGSDWNRNGTQHMSFLTMFTFKVGIFAKMPPSVTANHIDHIEC